MAEVAMHAGERNVAIDWLERAYENHHWNMLAILQDTLFAPLHQAPRFQALVQKVTSRGRAPG